MLPSSAVHAHNPKVAILAPLKEWGGLERTFSILSDEFVRAGIIPEFVRIRGGALPYPESLPPEVRSTELRTRSKVDGVPQVARYLRESAPDAVLTARDHSAQVAVLARRLAGVRVPLFISSTSMPSAVIRRPVQRVMARYLYPAADGVIAISRGVVDDLVRHLGIPRNRIHLIYNPVITRDFTRRCETSVEWPWLERADRVPVIVSAGRFSSPKDFVTLIDAFAKLRKVREARLLLLGEGADRAKIEQRIAEHELRGDVAMPGRVDDPVPYMHRSSLFVFSSRYEGLGNVLIEAVASGTRIVATDCPSGPSEILEGGRYGRLVVPGDSETLATAMDAALDDPRPSASVAEEACRRFTAEGVANDYIRLLGLAGRELEHREAEM
jgi:glycosyltransferase involved in cell wall biosynthesis